MPHWHSMETADVLQHLGSDASQGLSTEEACRRFKEHGPNALIEPGRQSLWHILWAQLTETLVIMLLVAAVLSAVLGDYNDAVGIMAIVVLIACLGFSQEYRAQQAIATLKKLAVPMVKVRRGGAVQDISALHLVLGDIMLLEAEDIVPADCRVLSSAGLRTQEAALTGVSEPVDKDPKPLPGAADLMLSHHRNMVYMGTVVTAGRGQAVVTATGMHTELGRITAMIQTVEPEPTPLQKRLAQLGRGLAVASVALVGLIMVLGLLRGEDFKLMFLTAITLMVAALPEGLPAVVTIALALGAQRMLKRRALIRNLPAVETLGSVTVICSGKTGTLTENRMTVTVLDVAGHRLDLTARLRGVSPTADTSQEISVLLSAPPAFALLLAGSTLCNNAHLAPDPDEPRAFCAVGDPTEGAIVMTAARQGLSQSDLEHAMPRVAEVPFDPARQRMTTVHRFPTTVAQIPCALETVWHWSQGMRGAPYLAFTKGRVENLLDVCSQVWVDGRTASLDDRWRARIVAAQQQLRQNGLRVLGTAFRPTSSSVATPVEQDFIFIGVIGMHDPARPEVREAVLACKTAGIRLVMITGDHPLTAQHIAHEVGIMSDDRLLTGADLSQLSVAAWADLVEEVSVYAQVSPEHKFDIVGMLQKRRHIVAMTGDGVNDAPALRKADIGIAMGLRGTDMAKEAADMVLLDDNFATIVAAVQEGRVIYDNIRKFMKYLFSSNTGELWVMLLAPFVGMPLPLLPLQILWINLTTDGLPALALGLEPAERDTMQRPPYSPHENIFGRGLGGDIIWIGLLMSLTSVGTGYVYWHAAHPGWQTMLFSTLTLSQMGNALALRSERDALWRIGLLSNKPLLAAVILTLGLQLAVVYVPFLQHLFTTVALSARDMAICLVVSGERDYAAPGISRQDVWRGRRGCRDLAQHSARPDGRDYRALWRGEDHFTPFDQLDQPSG